MANGADPEAPQVSGMDGESIILLDAGGSRRACRPGDVVDEWRLEAVVRLHGRALAVLERTSPHDTTLLYADSRGAHARLSWPIGELAALANDPPGPAFPEGYFREIRESGADILASRVLDEGGDPDLRRLEAALPPLVSYTFVGDRRIAEKPLVEPNGTVVGYFDAERAYDPDDPRVVWRHALVSGSLPAIAYAFYDREGSRGREEIAFGRPRSRGGLGVWVRLRDESGKHSYLRCRKAPEKTTAAEFYAALLGLVEEQQALLQPSARVEAPDGRVEEGTRAALLRGFLTFVGPHPKYGLGCYARPEHDTFPPAVLYLASAALEWGLFQECKALLGNYLASFVRPDGSFAYYGPSISEYGQMLALVNRCRQLAGNGTWFAEHLTATRCIADRLLTLRAKSKVAYAPGSPLYGLIPGIPEADYTGMGLPLEAYYSGDAWACRGLKEFAGALAAVGDAEGAALYGTEAEAYLADIRASLEASTVRETGPPFLPAMAGRRHPYRSLTESTPASYANYRFYPELLSAGILSPEQADAVLRYRWTHGGDLLAMTRFCDQLDDWPVAHYAWGLLEADCADRFRLLLYAHLLHHQSRGTYTAYEQVAFDPKGSRVRRHVADYCVCAQLIVPLMLKWMLVWEPWDQEVLWLNRAAPCAWHAPGQSFGFRDMPTRWGPVSLRVDGKESGIQALARLPEGVPEVRLRLHPPHGKALRALRVNGEAHPEWEGNTVVLRHSPAEVRVTGEW